MQEQVQGGLWLHPWQHLLVGKEWDLHAHFNVYHGSLSHITEDEDLTQEIHEHLRGLRKKYLTAMDVVQYLELPEIKERFKLSKSPSE
ncbi:hypothetical protein M422DRAFT_239242 [Sphaerobolus stellatus SS14]|nr:hypothetical protein M422DRAFT_239242 [Sphaerobolus stellatus SS14]